MNSSNCSRRRSRDRTQEYITEQSRPSLKTYRLWGKLKSFQLHASCEWFHWFHWKFKEIFLKNRPWTTSILNLIFISHFQVWLKLANECLLHKHSNGAGQAQSWWWSLCQSKKCRPSAKWKIQLFWLVPNWVGSKDSRWTISNSSKGVKSEFLAVRFHKRRKPHMSDVFVRHVT